MKNRAFVLDIDGTLVDDNDAITSETKKSIKNAIDNGWKVYLATGKSLRSARPFYKKLNLDTYLITSQGQVISNPRRSNHPLRVKPLSNAQIANMVTDEALQKHAKNIIIETTRAIYSDNDKTPELLTLINNSKPKLSTAKFKYTESCIGFYFNISPISDKKTKQYINFLSERHPTVDFQYWYTDYEDTTITAKPKNCNKWSGVKWVAKQDKIDFIVAIGNGWSDRKMLIGADIGIAMKNSVYKLRRIANFVSEFDNNSNGASHEINKIVELDGKVDRTINKKNGE